MPEGGVRPMAKEDWPSAFELHELSFGRNADAEAGARWLETLALEACAVAEDASGRVVGVQCGTHASMATPDGRVPALIGCFAAVAPHARGVGLYRQLFDGLRATAEELGAAAVLFNVSSARVFSALGATPLGVCADITFTPTASIEFAMPPGLFVEIIPSVRSAARCRAIHDVCADDFLGVPDLSPSWWRAHTAEASARFTACAIAHRAGRDTGYVRYVVNDEWIAGRGAGRIDGQELVGVDEETRDALVAYLARHDGVLGGRIRNCDLRDGLRWARRGIRGVRVDHVYDHLWAADMIADQQTERGHYERNHHCPFVV